MHVNDITPSLGRVYCDFNLPITGTGMFRTLDGEIVKLSTSVTWYAFCPTYHLDYNEHTISVTNKDSIPEAELALCMLINQSKDNK